MDRQEERFFKKVNRYTRKLAKEFPDILIHDLHLIVFNLFKPKLWPKRFLLKRVGEDKYVL